MERMKFSGENILIKEDNKKKETVIYNTYDKRYEEHSTMMHDYASNKGTIAYRVPMSQSNIVLMLPRCSSSKSASLFSLSSKISKTIAEVEEFVIVALLH
uniref:Uncharacterized protein n=1 Tax=Glossina pallidipes TaxID=7398 RepID=A0A1B0AK44_GLOPL